MAPPSQAPPDIAHGMGFPQCANTTVEAAQLQCWHAPWMGVSATAQGGGGNTISAERCGCSQQQYALHVLRHAFSVAIDAHVAFLAPLAAQALVAHLPVLAQVHALGVDLLLPLVAAAEPVALVCETNETASSTLFTWLQDPFYVPRVTPLV